MLKGYIVYLLLTLCFFFFVEYGANLAPVRHITTQGIIQKSQLSDVIPPKSSKHPYHNLLHVSDEPLQQNGTTKTQLVNAI